MFTVLIRGKWFEGAGSSILVLQAEHGETCGRVNKKGEHFLDDISDQFGLLLNFKWGGIWLPVHWLGKHHILIFNNRHRGAKIGGGTHHQHTFMDGCRIKRIVAICRRANGQHLFTVLYLGVRGNPSLSLFFFLLPCKLLNCFTKELLRINFLSLLLFKCFINIYFCKIIIITELKIIYMLNI